MKVYVLMETSCGYDDDDTIVGIFESKSKLVAYFNTYIAEEAWTPMSEEAWGYGDYDIHEVEVQ